MAADQNLIQATRAMGVSKYRDDSGWVKALASIGKYVAAKQSLKQQLNKNADDVFATIEEADIEGLVEYKELAKKYTKIIAKQPSWSKKYKQATKDYNDLMKAVELNKAGNTAFAAYEQKLEANKGGISKVHVGKEDDINDEILFGRYTKTFTNEGPSLNFPELGLDILVSDLPGFTLVSEGKDVTEAIAAIVNKNGAQVKKKNAAFVSENVVKDLNGSMSWWGDKKQRDIQMFDIEYSYNGESNFTFGNYIAEKHGFNEVLDEAEKQAGGFEPGEREATKNVMISMINEGNTLDYLKKEYINFITEVSRQDHQVNKSQRIDKNTGKNVAEPGDLKVSFPWNNDSTYIPPKTAIAYRNAILNASEDSAPIDWYTGAGYVYKPVLLEEERGVKMYGWERYNNGVKDKTFTIPEMLGEFGVNDLNMSEILDYYKDEKEEELP